MVYETGVWLARLNYFIGRQGNRKKKARNKIGRHITTNRDLGCSQ